jgi:hypothetical protein
MRPTDRVARPFLLNTYAYIAPALLPRFAFDRRRA